MHEIKDIVFRKSMNGYNKTDVNNYLISVNNKFSEIEEALKDKILRAEKSEREAIEKFESLELTSQKEISEKNSEIQKLLSEMEELIKEQDSKVHKQILVECEEKVREQEIIISKQFEEIEFLKNEIEKMKETLAQGTCDSDGEYDELIKKAQLFDRTSANIGEAIISANKTAEEIIAEAKEEARIITERTQRELDEKRQNFEKSSRLALESIFEKLVSAASEGRRDVANASSFAFQTIERALAEIQNRNENVNTKIKNYENSLWKSIKGDLESISTKGQHRKLGIKK